MDKSEIEELWLLLGKEADGAIPEEWLARRHEIERVYELARLAVCEIRAQRAAMQALKQALEVCDAQ